MWSAHLASRHSGAERTLAEFQQRFWAPGPRKLARRLVSKCPGCWVRTKEPVHPIMAPLPAARLAYGKPPFAGTGIDFFGPMQVTVRRSTAKRWGCLFTCLSTRAIHIKIAHSLDVNSFINAMRRFIARRGRPKIIYSDNGTNLTAGERELRASLETWEKNDITREATKLRIDWRFSPPAGPHFGGVWERPIQSAKRALYAVLKGRITTDETLSTLMAEVEAFLNARPLTHISVDPTDPEPITPNHFLLGRAAPHIPPDIFTVGETASRKDWRAAQQLAEEVWRRWLREYVPRLITREKWTQEAKPLREDNIALIVDGNAPRGQWTMCRVIKPIPGKDRVVRQADVKIASGKILRQPVVKLVVLETSRNDKEETTHSGVARAGDVANGAISEERSSKDR